MEWIGAALIIFSTTWTGFDWAKKLNERPRQLRQLKVALQALEAEIVYGLTPLDEACYHLSTQLTKPLNRFFEDFSKRLREAETTAADAWFQSLEDVWSFTALKNGELEILKQFGATLGRHDREQQQKQIRLTLAHLDREVQEAIESQGKYEKMVKSLGFLSGLLLVILLI
jgi:stage III sporulation protein AB